MSSASSAYPPSSSATVAGLAKQSADVGAAAAQTQTSLTDSTGGTNGVVLSDPGSAAQAGLGATTYGADVPSRTDVNNALTTIRNNTHRVADELALVKADVGTVITELNALRTALRNAGLMA